MQQKNRIAQTASLETNHPTGTVEGQKDE